MTSQKSLKNNVNRNDFRRSFLGALPFPLIALAILFTMVTIPVIQYVTYADFKLSTEHTEISMFLAPGSTFFYTFELLPIGMVICGMLTALKSFYFMLSKKQVNVFLSLGIKRNTMVTNRLISGVVALFVAVFLPIFIIYIINGVNFGFTVHLAKLFMYFVSLLFVCGLTGYSLVSAMTMVSGNIFEAVGSSAALSAIPFCAFSTLYTLASDYLKGHIRNYENESLMMVLTPWTMALNMNVEYRHAYVDDIYDYSNQITPMHILRLLQRTVPAEEFKVPAELNVDWGFMFPVVLWLVISVTLIGVTYYLFNRRAAEHANSLGKFHVSRAVLGTCAFAGITWIFSEWFGRDVNLYALFVILVAISLIVYFLIQLILTRKPKTALKSMKWCYGLIGALAVCCIVINTGLLGTYNRIPDKADIKSVTIEVSELSGYDHFIYPWDHFNNYVESSTDESKETLIKLYELLKAEKVKNYENFLTSVTFGIRDNDGKMKYREFEIYTEETYVKYIQLVYGSDYFDAILKNYLIEDIPENPQDDSTGYLKRFDWAYSDDDMIVSIKTRLSYITDVNGLCEALYKDLSVMSVDELFKNNNSPVGILIRGSSNEDYPGITPAYADYMYEPMSVEGHIEYVTDEMYEEPEHAHTLVTERIPVYAEMTNTLSFLESNGYEITEKPLKIKEVLYTDSQLPLMSAVRKFAEANKDKYKGWGDWDNYFGDYLELNFDQTYIAMYGNDRVCYYLDEPISEYNLLKKIYKDAGHSLESVTDAEKIQKIVDKTTSQYLTLNDNGRYVYVIYEEGPIVCYYLPEANLSVIK